MRIKRDIAEKREDFIRHGRVGQWVFYIDRWWKIIKKMDWIEHEIQPSIILFRKSKGMVWYIGV